MQVFSDRLYAEANARHDARAYGGHALGSSNGNGGDAKAYTEIGDTTSQGWEAWAICGNGNGSGFGGTTPFAWGGSGVSVFYTLPWSAGNPTKGAEQKAK